MKLVGTLSGHQGPVYKVCFNTDEKYCLSCGQDRKVLLWNPHKTASSSLEKTLVHSYDGIHGYDVLDISIASDNASFASCGSDKNIFVRDVASGRVLQKFSGHTQRVNAVTFKKTDVVISASYDKSVCIWDARSNSSSYRPIQTLSDARDSVTTVVTSSNDNCIITGSVDGCVRTYDIRKGMVFQDEVFEPVTNIQLSEDDNVILVSCLDSCIRLLDRTDSGKLLKSYEGHVNKSFPVQAVFANSDSQVVSGSEDGRVVKWDLVSSELTEDVRSSAKAISSIAVTKKEKHSIVLAASYDGIVRIYYSN